MQFKQLIYILICGILCFGAGDMAIPDASAARTAAASQSSANKSSSKKSRSKKSRKSSGRKSSSRKSSSRKSSKKKRSTRKKSSRSKSKNRKGTGRKRGRNAVSTRYVAPPKEVAQNDSLTLAVNDALIREIPEHLNPGGLRVNSVRTTKGSHTAAVSLNENFTYLPVTRGLIDTLQRNVRQALPDSLSDYKVSLSVNGKPLTYYITRVD